MDESNYLADPFSQVQNAWNDLLSRYAWDWFCTFTFPAQDFPNAHPEQCDKLFRVWINKLMIDEFGKYWYRNKSQDGIYWVRALEYHKSGIIHYHALLKFPKNMRQPLRYRAEEHWEELAGWCKCEKINLHGATINYIIKYAVKHGNIELSESMVNCPYIPAYTDD